MNVPRALASDVLLSVRGSLTLAPPGFEEWYCKNFPSRRGYLLALSTWMCSIPLVAYLTALIVNPGVSAKSVVEQIGAAEVVAGVQQVGLPSQSPALLLRARTAIAWWQR